LPPAVKSKLRKFTPVKIAKIQAQKLQSNPQVKGKSGKKYLEIHKNPQKLTKIHRKLPEMSRL